MSDYAVGDKIVVRISETLVRRGVITKIVHTPAPGWSNKIPGYTIIQYRESNGGINVCSDNSPCLSKRNALDDIAEAL
jgi:hypothetical protein